MPARPTLSLRAIRDDYRRLSPPERRLWRWPMMWVSAAAITAVPLAYATIYLSSALDPYGNLAALPVALVNADRGTETGGRTYRLGQDVMRDLTREAAFRYTTYPTEDAAHAAVRRGDAYFALTIPETFSRDAVAGSSAQHGQLNVYVAEGSNYFASRVATTFSTTLADELNRTLGETRWTVVQRSLNDVQRGFTTLRAATGELADGAAQLKIGTRQLAYRAGTLADGARAAADGGQQVVTGAADVSTAVARLSAGTGQLATGVRALAAATPDPATLTPLSTGTAALAQEARDLATALDGVAGGAARVGRAADTAAATAGPLAQGAADLAAQLPRLQATLAAVATDAATLADTARTAGRGGTRLADSAAQLADTLPDVQRTVTQLAQSATQLSATAAALNGSARQLAQASGPLAAQLPGLAAALAQTGGSATQLGAAATTFAQQTAAMNVNLRSQLLVPQALRENVASLAAQAEDLRTNAGTLRARIDQLAAPVRRAAATPVATGSVPFATAVTTVADRAGTLEDRLTDAARRTDAAAQATRTLQADTATLAAATDALGEGAGAVSADLAAARTASAAAAQAARTVQGRAAQVAGTVQAVRTDAADLAAQATRAQAAARTLQASAATVDSGVQDLARGSAQVRTAVDRLSGALPDPADVTAARTGAATLAARSADLRSGLSTVASGADAVRTGATDVNTGAGKLLDGVNALKAKIPERVESLTGDPAGLSVSVQPNVQTFAPVKNNGAAFAPYFMALSLWVGVTLTTFIFPYQQLPRTGRRSSQVARVLRKAAAPAVLVSVQALLVVLAVQLLGVAMLHPGQVIVTAVASSVTFLMMVLALIFCFGAAGRLLALILLVLQLAASGGSYPVETAPPFFQAIHAWLPVTQSVGALRHGLSGALEGQYPTFMLTLLAVFATSFGVALLGRRRWEYVADHDFRPLISAPMVSRDVPPDPVIDAESPVIDAPPRDPADRVPNG